MMARKVESKKNNDYTNNGFELCDPRTVSEISYLGKVYLYHYLI